MGRQVCRSHPRLRPAADRTIAFAAEPGRGVARRSSTCLRVPAYEVRIGRVADTLLFDILGALSCSGSLLARVTNVSISQQ